MSMVPPLTSVIKNSGASSVAGGSPYTLTLGSVRFADLEHPTKLPIPLAQQIAVHQQAGGTRTVQTFGAQPGDITWSGLLFYRQATERAGELRKMCALGKPVPLRWGAWSWRVIVAKADLVIHHQFEIAYTVTCTVISDKTSHATNAVIQSIDAKNQALYDQILARFNALNQLDPTTTSWNTSISAVGSQLGVASPLSSATPAQISQALQQVTSTIGLVSPYVSALQSSTGTNVSQQLFTAQGILSGLQVISSNLASGNPAATIVVASGSLFTLAAQHYGDPSLWTTIAAANNLTSPFLPTGTSTTLAIPPKPTVSQNSLSASNVPVLAIV